MGRGTLCVILSETIISETIYGISNVLYLVFPIYQMVYQTYIRHIRPYLNWNSIFSDTEAMCASWSCDDWVNCR
jgi:hypothetical protein